MEEKIKMAENIKALREAGIGEQLASFGEVICQIEIEQPVITGNGKL